MPNYTSCRLAISGPKERVLALADAVRGPHHYPRAFPENAREINDLLSSLSFLSGHEKLQAIERGLQTAEESGIDLSGFSQDAVNAWAMELGGGYKDPSAEASTMFNLHRIVPAPLTFLVPPFANFRDWANEAWGSHYCECHGVEDEEDRDGGTLLRTFYLTTAWSPTIPPVIALMERFRDLQIVYLWVEQGNDEAGVIFRDGDGEAEVVSSTCSRAMAAMDKHTPCFDEEDIEEEISDSEIMEWYLQEYVGK